MKFYQDEKKYNADLYEIKIHTRQAQKLANKLSRHFHFRKVKVHNTARSRGTAYTWSINVPKITNVGLLIHEMAHIWNGYRFGNERAHHTKKLHTAIKRLSAYFRKNLKPQFATLELPKPKPKKTQLQKYQDKLERDQASIKRLTTKVKSLKTRIRNTKKRQTYIKRQIRQIVREGIRRLDA